MLFRTGLAPLAVCCALFLIPHGASAQLKVAVVSMQQAMADSAETQKIEADMQAKYRPRQAEIDKVTADGAALQKQLETGQGTLAPDAAADLQAAIARDQRQLQRLNEDFQADLERDRNEVLSKSSQKMSAVVKKLAEERGFDLVVDVSSSVYYKPALDITKDVVAAYNQAYPASAAAPAAK